MKGFSGYEVEDHVDMLGKPTMNNFKLLLDIFPFKNNKHWHFTAGFYWGPSQFAKADNTTEAMTSLLAVGIYNRMYELSPMIMGWSVRLVSVIIWSQVLTA